MRLARVGAPGQERPVALGPDGGGFDLTGLTDDLDAAFFAGNGIARAEALVAAGQAPPLDLRGLRVGAPVARPGKVACIGLNFRDHAAETGAPVPTEPVVFLKASNTVVGPDDDVLIPRGSTKTDYEVELAVVIGSTARYLDSPDAAPAHIAGYAVAHDVSERAFQLERGGQWDKGKSCETFNPLGPWLVTPGEVGDPQQLGMRLWVNGEKRQDGHTSDMVFGVNHIIWYLSQFMVLEPGDVVNTGTPAGVAHGSSRVGYLRAGDVVEIEIDGLGRQRQQLRSA